MERWIGKSTNSIESFAANLPSVLARGLLVRRILLEQLRARKDGKDLDLTEETKDEEETAESPRIFSVNLYGNESDYAYYFLINMLCACSYSSMPPEIAEIILQYIAKLRSEGKIEDKAFYTEDVVQRLGSVRDDL